MGRREYVFKRLNPQVRHEKVQSKTEEKKIIIMLDVGQN